MTDKHTERSDENAKKFLKMPNIKLVAKDDGITEVDLEVVKKSITIKSLLENANTPTEEQEEELIPVPNVTTPILRKVVEWMIHHKDDYPLVEDDNGEVAADVLEDAWDTQFLQMDGSQLLNLLKVAHYLDIKVLLNMGAKKMPSMILGCQTPEEMRALLNVQNDFSPEEEQQTRAENAWCMEP
ncbi:E3 ubiquitin ligase complex SCF subunit sconC, partial [Orchesella cincta]